jgi:hypothetical protein
MMENYMLDLILKMIKIIRKNDFYHFSKSEI